MKYLVMALIMLWTFPSPALSAQRSAKATKKPVAVKAHKKVKPKAFRKAHVTARTHRVALEAPFDENAAHPDLRSSAAFILDPSGGRTLYAKNITAVQPIASITKLMTAMVVLDAGLELGEELAITEDDVDLLKHTRSRLHVGAVLTRDDLMRLALMASENRAASALARSYPGGTGAFVHAMNQKAVALGMSRSRFVDGSGLSSENVSTAEDLAKMVAAAYSYPLIQQYTTLTDYTVRLNNGKVLAFRNTNGLVKNDQWHIDVSKTGYISEAGRCLVMQARIATKPVVIVLLDSWGKYTRIADANRVKKWVEAQFARPSPG